MDTRKQLDKLIKAEWLTRDEQPGRREGFSGKADSDNEFMFFLTFTVDVMPEETYETDVNRQLHSQIKEELQNMLIGKELNFEWEGEYDAEHDSDKDYNVSGQITSIGRNT